MVAEDINETECQTAAVQTYYLTADAELAWPVIDRFVEQVRALHAVFELLQTNEDAIPPEGVLKMNSSSFKIELPLLEEEQEPKQREVRYFDANKKGSHEIYFFDSEGDENQANLLMSPDETGQMSTFRCSRSTEIPGELLLKKITTVEVQISEKMRELRAFILIQIPRKEQTLEQSVIILRSMCEFLQPFVEVAKPASN